MCALRVLIYKGVISFVAKLACTHWAVNGGRCSGFKVASIAAVGFELTILACKGICLKGGRRFETVMLKRLVSGNRRHCSGPLRAVAGVAVCRKLVAVVLSRCVTVVIALVKLENLKAIHNNFYFVSFCICSMRYRICPSFWVRSFFSRLARISLPKWRSIAR